MESKNIVSILVILVLYIKAHSNSFDSVAGYKGVDWGASIKSASKTLKAVDGNCFAKVGFRDKDIEKMVIEESGLNEELIFAISGMSSNRLKPEIKVRKVEDGCVVFLKDSFRIVAIALREPLEDVKQAIEKKYGPTRLRKVSGILNDSYLHIVDGANGKIFIFGERTKHGKTTVVMYVSKDLHEIKEIQTAEKIESKKQTDKVKKAKQEKLDSL